MIACPPMSAHYRYTPATIIESVAIIAMDEERFWAIDEDGRVVVGKHGEFEITDAAVQTAIAEARWGRGS